jgi:hypothetical protein
MADDKNFKALIAEQKKTTTALNKLAGIEEQSSDKKERSAAQQAADDKMRGKRNEKHQIKIEKQGKTEDGTGTPPPAAGEEDKKDRMKSLANAIGKPLGKFGKSIGGAIKSLGNFFKDKFGGGVKTLGNLLKFGVAGLALMALSKFFKSPTWDEWKKTLIPALVTAFEFISSTIKSAGEMIVTGVKAIHSLLTGGLFEGEGKDRKFIGMGAAFDLVLEAVKGLGTAFIGIGLLLAPKALLFGLIKTGITAVKTAMGILRFFFNTTLYQKIWDLASTGAKGAGARLLNGVKAVGRALTALKVFMMSTLAPAIMNLVRGGITGAGGAIMRGVRLVGGALTALRTFMMASLLPAITGMLAGFAPLLVPLLIVVGVIAAVALVIASIKNAFDDFKATLEETGSIFEALKVGFASLVANVLGIIPNLIIDFVAWIFKKLGWTEWAAKLKEIDVVSFIKNGLLNIFTKLGEWIGLIYDDYIKPLLAPLLKFFDPVISLIKTVFNFLLDAIQPVVDIITKIGAKVVDFVKGLIPKLPSWLGGGDDTEEKVIVPEIIKLEEDSVTLAKVQEERIKGNIADTSNMVSEYDGVSDAIKRQKEDSSTTVISAPVSNTTNMSSSTNISKTIVEPDAYFLRQSGWAI